VNGPARPDLHDLVGTARVQARAGTHVAISAQLTSHTEFVPNTGSITVSGYGVGVYAGRTTPGYATTESGSVVLAGSVPFTGAGFYLTDPIHLPGVLRHIGPIGFESMLAHADEQPGNYDTWFWTARGKLQPFRWMGFNITRAAYVTSLQPNTPPSTKDLLLMLVGQNDRPEDGPNSYGDNQVVAIDGWFRSLDPRVPVTLYWDWGADDSSGAWWTVGGRVFGMRVAALPGLPQASAGVEFVDFQGPNEKHGPWYWHGQMREGWSENGLLLGHGLGGHGSELVLYGSADVPDARVRLKGRALVGTRRSANVYAPARIGSFRGGALSGSGVFGDRGEWDVAAHGEWGDGWRETRVVVSVGYRVGGGR
jgi:hypothetical protein